MLARIKTSYHRILNKLSQKWKENHRKWLISGLIWIASFSIGLLISHFWGIGILLLILIVTYIIALVLHRNKVVTFTVKQFWGRIRGIILFTLLPAFLEIIRKLIISFSLSAVFELVLAVLFIALIWTFLSKIMEPFIPEE
jgi:hypothetical protein